MPPGLELFPSAPRAFPATFDLVQSTRPLDDAWYAALVAAGDVAQSYFRSNTILVRRAEAAGASTPPATQRWRGPYVPAHRLSRAAADAWLGIGPPTLQDDGRCHVRALFVPDESPADALDDILDPLPAVLVVALIEPDATRGRPGALELAALPADIAATVERLATTAPVRFVHVQGTTVLNGPLTSILHQGGVTDSVQPHDYSRVTRAFAHGLNGKGQVIAVADTFFRAAECHFVLAPGDITPSTIVPTPTDWSLPLPTTVSSATGKVITYYITDAADSDAQYSTGLNFFTHGQRSAGAAAGDSGPCRVPGDDAFALGNCATGPSGVIEHVDPFDGAAPGAGLVLQAFGNSMDTDWARAFYEQSYHTIAGPRQPRIDSNSWGLRDRLDVVRYSDLEEAVDEAAWLQRDFTIVHSAGNEGAAPGFHQNPSHAKSALIVGAMMGPEPSYLPVTFAPSLYDDLLPANAHRSEHGPGVGHRVKPDLVAAGEVATADAPPTYAGVIGPDECLNGWHVATSAAAPTASGLARS